jgi:hypothetical protein
MQDAIADLVKLGPLPSSDSADPKVLERYQRLIGAIRRPVSDAEARVLMEVFGPDECFGLAWSLLHLVESAPGWPLEDCLLKTGNEWADRLRQRAERG